MTEQEYNKIDAVRATALKGFIKNPNKYKYELSNPKDTSAFKLGTAVHMAYLEPERFESHYLIFDCKTNKDGSVPAKSKPDLLKALENSDKEEYLTTTELTTVNSIIESLPKLLLKAQNEVTFVKEIEGVQCKCRVDSLMGNIGMDLKTTQDCTPEKFKWAIRDYGYMWQFAFYSLVSGIDRWIIRAVEKTAPFNFQDYIIEPEDLQPYKEQLIGKYGYIKQLADWKANGMPTIKTETIKISELWKS